MLELEIKCTLYFIPGGDSYTVTLTLGFIKKVSIFVKKLFVIRLEETEDNM